MRKITVVLLLVFVFLITPLAVFAESDSDQRNVVLPKGEVVNKDYFAAGNTVSLDGTVNGDAYIAGGNVVVNGTINGDLLAAAGNIDIRGTVTGDIRAAGGNINIAGTAGRNTSLAGGTINLDSNADIKGSLVAAAGNLSIGSKIGTDVNVAVGQLNLTRTALVGGNLTYLSQNQASISQEAKVTGQVTQNVPRGKQPSEQAKQGVIGFFTFLTLADFILTAIIGVLLIIFLPVYFEKTAEIAIRKPWLSLGIGLLTVIVFPFIFLLLLATVIGIPVAFVLAFILAIFGYLAKIFVSFVIGQLIFRRFNKETNLIWPFLVGLIIYFILMLIPIAGWIIATIAGLIGLGAILIEEKVLYSELRGKKTI